jgi:hypothetical protein
MDKPIEAYTRGGGMLGFFISIIIAVAVAIRITVDLVGDLNVTGTTGTVVGLIPTIVVLLLLVALSVRVTDYVR